MKTKLNLGCGLAKLDDYLNVDFADFCKPDQIVDLEALPWPWPDDSFDTIRAKDILEHLGAAPRDFLKIIAEMYRVSKPGAIWHITVPHWRCDNALNDPTHVRVITSRTFELFDQAKNVENYQRGLSHSALGLQEKIDLETVGVDFDIIGIWLDQLRIGNIDQQELNLKLNTLNNICESTHIYIRCHKPSRYAGWTIDSLQG